MYSLRDYGIEEVIYTYKIKEIMVLMAKKGKIEALIAKY